MSLQERYLTLSAKRDQYLERARTCSAITIPQLLPPSGSETGASLDSPSQADGAQGVNALAAKILLALMPPNIPVFRLETVDLVADLMKPSDPRLAEEAIKLRKNLDMIPRHGLRLTETLAHRPIVFEGIKHLIVAGNVCFWYLPDGRMRSVPLSRYVVLRDSLGFVLEVIVCDPLSAANLPNNLDKILKLSKGDTKKSDVLTVAAENKTPDVDSQYDLYTGMVWDPEKKKYRFFQEFMGKEVEDSSGLYRVEDAPLSPQRFYSSDCEDYGRSHVEEYYGLLAAIEVIAQSETALAVNMAELRWTVSAASGMRARDVERTPNGGYLDAEPDTIQAISADKYGDLAAVAATKRELQQKFGLAFLVNTSIQRSGERVTAEEIRLMMNLLDSTLGGLYSSLSVEFQSPYVNNIMRLLKKQQGLDLRYNSAIQIRIVTGIEALGQSHEGQQFFELVERISALVGPAAFAAMMIPTNFADKAASYYNIDIEGLFKSVEQMQQEQAAAEQAEQNRAAVGPIVNAAGKALTQ